MSSNKGGIMTFQKIVSIVFLSAALLPITSFAGAQSNLRHIDRGDGKSEWVTFDQAMEISKQAHENGRCGGFFDLTDQIDVDSKSLPMSQVFTSGLSDRPLIEQQYLADSMGMLNSQNLFNTVTALSQFKNRYYKSPLGVKAAESIAAAFTALSKNRSDVKVELYKHKWAQPSVIATIQGSGPHANEIVVIGGHEDSINQGAFGSPDMNAPGADDNATGIATVLEVFRVLIDTNFKTDRTLMFMGYAGEEVGLLGSQDIANHFKKDKKAVVAVMQFDMTGFPGAGDQVTFMTDYTNPGLTTFSQKLMDTYVKAKWSTDRCGYACSDHASWYKAGYASVMPFEATMSTDNKDIHTSRDLMNKIDFNHGMHFAKLGLAFMAELSRDSAR
jgi:leucyl aminopeptidase